MSDSEASVSASIARSSVDNLVDDIRELYNKSKTSSDMSCDLVDEKRRRRSTANQRELAKNVARASKQFEETFKKRSFYEKMIERSKTVNAPSCSTVSDRQCLGHGNNACSYERLKSESTRSLRLKKSGNDEVCSYGRMPQVFFFISLNIQN